MKGASPSSAPAGAGALFRGVARFSSARRPAVDRGQGTMARAEGNGASEGRQPWDVSRFARTVMFFNETSPSKILAGILEQPFKLIRSFMGPQDLEESKTSVLRVLAPSVLDGPDLTLAGSKPPIDGIILVTGATGGVGSRVVADLLKRGATVRALVRDMEKAKKILGGLPCAKGGSLDVALGDITQKQTLLPDTFKGVRAVIICSSTVVAPVEGDTADRKKYRVGIKFYDPEIVGDTPESVEYVGVRNIVESCKDRVGLEAGAALLDPSTGTLTPEWGSLDDVVMGGCSESKIELMKGAGEDGGMAAVFSGNVTSANNGGFASVRSKNFAPAVDLGAYEGLQLRLKGDGQRYKLTLRQDTYWDSLSFVRSFDTTDGEWQTIKLPFSEFRPVFRAKTMDNGTKLDKSSITSVQIMLSKFEYDGGLNPNIRMGKFCLPVAYIKTYLSQPVTPRIVLLGSAGVTRVDRPGIDKEQEPPAVKLNEALGGILTFKLKGEDVVRGSGAPYTIVRPCALTEEPRGAPLELDQGDVIKGKVSRQDVAELLVEALSQPSVLDTAFEVKCTLPFSQPYEPEAGAEGAPRDWAALLEGANLRRGVTGKTIDGVYTGRVPEEEATASKGAEKISQ
ncbi:unnamed protein product [Ostreobium quekettii]|uniref:NADH:ubiquinone oxidoreductase complex I intermediate-associated protein 30 n=1 Tax=Ostreobium quekettii TaxID=121088 RepID=A0A8S1JC64_9CHLO|nr:unnamed protein product [Ostreobium quekettii]|eukprot:evm.model.scf_282EXC.2 EVM.evm.TU.scf_282EXC.2   scf_282EXC:11622-20974(+)